MQVIGFRIELIHMIVLLDLALIQIDSLAKQIISVNLISECQLARIILINILIFTIPHCSWSVTIYSYITRIPLNRSRRINDIMRLTAILVSEQVLWVMPRQHRPSSIIIWRHYFLILLISLIVTL